MRDKIDRIGILLLNLGGPDSLEAVRPFLFNLFSDRDIIRLGPGFLQMPLAWLISTIRSSKTQEMYRHIGGKSPILAITTAQANALEKALNQQSAISNQQSAKFSVYVGMRYWRPLIEDSVKKMYADGIRAVLTLSLYPHFSLATTGSAEAEFKKVIRGYAMESFCISSWYNHPLYIDALTGTIEEGLAAFRGTHAEVIFSAHGLPLNIVESGDPYVSHINATIEEVVKRIGVPWHLSYQSRSGPVRWLEPSTEDKIQELAKKGVKNLLLVPISFVSDHIETLYEIDILYKGIAGKLGITLHRSESLNTRPLFIQALEDIVRQTVKEIGWG